MSGKLPVDDFRWEAEVLIQQALAEPLRYLEELDKSGRSCFLMGDFHIPGEIHKLTHDYPFMPEKSCVPEAALSQKQRELNANNRAKHNPCQEYLLQTMWDKKGVHCLWRDARLLPAPRSPNDPHLLHHHVQGG